MKRGSRVLVAAIACAALAQASPALAAAGDLDSSFGGNGLVATNLSAGNDEALAVAIQADGRIVVAGRTTGGGGQIVVARYTTAGRLDPSFSGDGITRTNLSRGDDQANGVAVQPDGKIVVAATVDDTAKGRFAVLRYDANGSLDQTFSHDGRVVTAVPGGGSAAAVALQANGRIVVAGSATTHLLEFAVVRYRADGALDTSFAGNGMALTQLSGHLAVASAVAVQADGRIVVAGFAAGAGRFAVVRYTTAGALDPTFSGNGKALLAHGFASGLVVHAGKIVAAGGGNDRFAVVRLNGNGGLDPTFGRSGVVRTGFGGIRADGQAVAIQASGRIVVAGSTTSGRGRLALARYTTAGALDQSFGRGGRVLTAFPHARSTFAAAMALQAGGRIVVVGRASRLGGRLALARYLG